jgi:hypothetical protein
LQIHPLEGTGRARTGLCGVQPDETESAFAYIEATRLQQILRGRLRLQLDLTDRTLLCAEPQRGFAEAPGAEPPACTAAVPISPLVVEPDGTVFPVQYGFAQESVRAEQPRRGVSNHPHLVQEATRAPVAPRAVSCGATADG